MLPPTLVSWPGHKNKAKIPNMRYANAIKIGKVCKHIVAIPCLSAESGSVHVPIGVKANAIELTKDFWHAVTNWEQKYPPFTFAYHILCTWNLSFWLMAGVGETKVAGLNMAVRNLAVNVFRFTVSYNAHSHKTHRRYIYMYIYIYLYIYIRL